MRKCQRPECIKGKAVAEIADELEEDENTILGIIKELRIDKK